MVFASRKHIRLRLRRSGKSAETESEGEDTEGRRCAPPLEEEKNTFLITRLLTADVTVHVTGDVTVHVTGVTQKERRRARCARLQKDTPAASLAATRPLSRAGDWRRAAIQRAPILAPAALVGLRRTLGGWGQRPQ